MATVEQIIDRLAKEDPLYGLYRPGLGTSRTQAIQIVRPAEADVTDGDDVLKTKTWVPNRKILSAAVSGIATLGAFMLFGPDADPEIASSVTLMVMTAIGYFVPLPQETPES